MAHYTDREAQCVALLHFGLSYKQVAYELSITVATLKSYMMHARQRVATMALRLAVEGDKTMNDFRWFEAHDAGRKQMKPAQKMPGMPDFPF